ncbi:MAG TPA: DUF86 domain-containing protein [Thermoanaerobaculia bacterium]|nr:DUF86 domain-containing protein [Thermoanaerobaculia bacterium]
MTGVELQAKIDLARENFARLEQIPQDSLDVFLADFRNLDSALRRLQTTIQTVIDIGSWIIAARGLAAPETSRAVLDRLAEAGLIPPDGPDRWGPIIGFRNRIVHLYDAIDPRIVYEALREGRGELLRLFEALLRVLEETE